MSIILVAFIGWIDLAKAWRVRLAQEKAIRGGVGCVLARKAFIKTCHERS